MKKNKFLILFITMLMFVSTACDKKSNGQNPESDKDSVKNQAAQTPADSPDKYGRDFNDLARYFAGLPVEQGSKIDDLTATGEWKNHSMVFNQKWDQLTKERLVPITNWQKDELKKLENIETVFYPFGGPDFLFASTFFPNAKNLILIGLEPVGKLPDLNTAKKYLPTYLENLQKALNVLLTGGYFMTIEMEKDFKTDRLNGVVPVLMLFIARTGHQVLAVDYYDTEGSNPVDWDKPVDISQPNHSKLSAVRIKYAGSDKVVKTLTYISTDLSDAAFPKSKTIQDFVKGKQPFVTFLKAASYLLHRESFSQIRDFILTNTKYLVQDDSGLPHRFYNNENWKYQLYGVYTAPIKLFEVRYQDDFRKEFLKPENIKPLPFGYGYYWTDKRSNLLFAEKVK